MSVAVQLCVLVATFFAGVLTHRAWLLPGRGVARVPEATPREKSVRLHEHLIREVTPEGCWRETALQNWVADLGASVNAITDTSLLQLVIHAKSRHTYKHAVLVIEGTLARLTADGGIPSGIDIYRAQLILVEVSEPTAPAVDPIDEVVRQELDALDAGAEWTARRRGVARDLQ